VNGPEIVQGLATRMHDRGIKPELEVFDLGMANYARYLIDRGFLRPPFYANVFLGNVASAQATLLEMGVLLNALPTGVVWSVGGIGDAQLPMNAISIAYGGGVRVGIEDNWWFDAERTTLATNVDLVERVGKLAALNGREVMTAAAFRQLLELGPGPG
jgi:3-keto-5-aminohexanoate cleavage enzyme